MPKKVLIVDDEPENIRVIQRILQNAGYEVSSDNSAEECLDHLESEMPDMILCDVNLTGMSGTDFCSIVKNDRKFLMISVILISGIKVTPEERAYGLEIGADDYISRPFNSQELIARINSVFRIKESASKKREEEFYEKFNYSNTELTASVYQSEKIKNAYPEIFNRLVNDYKELLSMMIEQRTYKTADNPSTKILEFAGELGFLKAGARDIIDIHKEALNNPDIHKSAKMALFIKEESKMLLLEAMGYLLTFYRTRQL
ncbi:MAG: response regulator [Ignavibacteriales bacterium]|nr:response regulator [Ignavibacteriales bacterium]MCF8316844.1 response regulator [Ignavibacteriales bacterium]MCF8438117.1 response regulator [Ignavibacteriales bacterium]